MLKKKSRRPRTPIKAIASSPEISARMKRVKRFDTKPELQIRKLLHQAGLRYFVDRKLETDLRTKADLVFPRVKVAVFIDGCFWHSCPIHKSMPKVNRRFWTKKLNANQIRDRTNSRILRSRGWKVIRIWEHVDPTDAVKRIIKTVQLRLNCA